MLSGILRGYSDVKENIQKSAEICETKIQTCSMHVFRFYTCSFVIGFPISSRSYTGHDSRCCLAIGGGSSFVD